MTLWDFIKELVNYGALGVFAGFVLWGVVKGCKAIFNVLFSQGNEEKKQPKGLVVQVVESWKLHLVKMEDFSEKTLVVLVKLEESNRSREELCGDHVRSLEVFSEVMHRQQTSSDKVVDSLQRLVKIHEDPNGPANNEQTHRKLCAIQNGMVEYCVMCKKLAAQFHEQNPAISDIVIQHCDAIIKEIKE